MKDNFKELTYDEAVAKKDELSKKYFDLRFKRIVGHVESPVELRNLKRKVARLNTIITEYDLGIRK
jgi:large subunit ribosomal protein L29